MKIKFYKMVLGYYIFIHGFSSQATDIVITFLEKL
jgi:hypothetical protein